jgi:hypothetical protein
MYNTLKTRVWRRLTLWSSCYPYLWHITHHFMCGAPVLVVIVRYVVAVVASIDAALFSLKASRTRRLRLEKHARSTHRRQRRQDQRRDLHRFPQHLRQLLWM